MEYKNPKLNKKNHKFTKTRLKTLSVPKAALRILMLI